MILSRSNIRKKTSYNYSSGFALPTILIASMIMLSVLLVSVASTAAIRVSLLSQTYNQMAQTSGDAGVVYAKACLDANSGVPLWSDAKPLGPNTDCSGNQLAGFTCPVGSVDSRCYITANSSAPTAQVLVVGGGGGGGPRAGAGGGGGGFSMGSELLSGTMSVVVGDGGARVSMAGNSALTTPGGVGGTSTFGTRTALGGGGGNEPQTGPGGDAGTNGFTGGASGVNYTYGVHGGGGGGGAAAGSPGTTSSPYHAGNGGVGITYNGQQLCGGGGGGNDQYRGSTAGTASFSGGAGGTNGHGTDGIANTGGGGGGASNSLAGSQTALVNSGTGGSGVVVISYPTGSITATLTGAYTTSTSGSNTIQKFTSNGTFTVTSAGNGAVTSSFSVGLPTLVNGKAGEVNSVGSTKLLRSSTGTAWRTYSQSSRLTIPNIIVMANVYAWGGGGAGGTIGGWTYGSYGGAGGAAQGILNITTAGNSYPVVVGGGATINSYSADFKCAVGGGGCASNSNSDNRYSGGGGGYSGIFKSSVSQANALLIAGGGGGGSAVWSTNGDTSSESGGAGGGTSGQMGYGQAPVSYRGQPGTQSSAGANTSGPYMSVSGTAGANIQGALQGGTTVSNSYGGGGGGGYWGGSAGSYDSSDPSYPVNQMEGGGGGSGYFNPTYVSSGLLTSGVGTAPGDSGNSLRGSAGNAGGYQGNGIAGVVIISYPTGSITATGGTITTSGGNTIHTFTSSGTFRVGPIDPIYGSGADGAVTVAANKNINTDILATGRTCADAVNYSVTTLTTNTATLSTTPAAGCLVAGDEVLLINLQGISANYGNVGNYETLRIQSISTNTITFTANKVKFYGNGASDDTNLGTATTNQRVILQRVPNYASLTVNTGITLSANAWDGTKGGVLFFRANGSVGVVGSINLTGKGWRGGVGDVYYGGAGESYNGGPIPPSSSSPNANGGGGGGGDSRGTWDGGTGAPGGAGYAVSGTNGGLGRVNGFGYGGASYGLNTLSKICYGSGGGGNAVIDWADYNNGGVGGGIIVIFGSDMTVSGSISANGTDGVLTSHQTSGGSGGSIYIKGGTVTVGSGLVTAKAGASGDGANGGGGAGNSGPSSAGRIRIDGTLTGTTNPTAYTP